MSNVLDVKTLIVSIVLQMLRFVSNATCFTHYQEDNVTIHAVQIKEMYTQIISRQFVSQHQIPCAHFTWLHNIRVSPSQNVMNAFQDT